MLVYARITLLYAPQTCQEYNFYTPKPYLPPQNRRMLSLYTQSIKYQNKRPSNWIYSGLSEIYFFWQIFILFWIHLFWYTNIIRILIFLYKTFSKYNKKADFDVQKNQFGICLGWFFHVFVLIMIKITLFLSNSVI